MNPFFKSHSRDCVGAIPHLIRVTVRVCVPAGELRKWKYLVGMSFANSAAWGGHTAYFQKPLITSNLVACLGALGCSLSLDMEDRAVSWDAGFRAKVRGVQTKRTGWSLPAQLSPLVKPVTKTTQSPEERGWEEQVMPCPSSSAPRHRQDRLATWKRQFLEGNLSPQR